MTWAPEQIADKLKNSSTQIKQLQDYLKSKETQVWDVLSLTEAWVLIQYKYAILPAYEILLWR